jgi:hypothetical protein
MNRTTIKLIDAEGIATQLTPFAHATAYRPLPIDPLDDRASFFADGNPAAPPPKPSPSPSPDGPAYPPLPLEPDTKDGDKPEQK